MQAERLNFLLTQVKENPDDPFNYFALALEYTNSEPIMAKKYFEMVIEKFPNYEPTYYMAAQFYWNNEDLQKAKNIYEKGLRIISPDSKAYRELKSAYSNFLDENDD